MQQWRRTKANSRAVCMQPSVVAQYLATALTAPDTDISCGEMEMRMLVHSALGQCCATIIVSTAAESEYAWTGFDLAVKNSLRAIIIK
jgi:hypothetical protein